MYTFWVLLKKAQMAKFVFVEDFLSLSFFAYIPLLLFFFPSLSPLHGLRSCLRVLSLHPWSLVARHVQPLLFFLLYNSKCLFNRTIFFQPLNATLCTLSLTAPVCVCTYRIRAVPSTSSFHTRCTTHTHTNASYIASTLPLLRTFSYIAFIFLYSRSRPRQ